MAKAAAQAAAKELLERVLKEGIVIPGDEKQQHMRMGQILMGTKANNEFDFDAAFQQVQAQYGKKKKEEVPLELMGGGGEEEEAAAEAPPKKKRAAAKKKPKAEDEDDEDDEEEAKPKKKGGRKKKADAEDGEKPTPKKRKPEKEKEEGEEEDDEEGESPKKKKSKKIETVCPENEELANLFGEMGRHFFKEKDMMRGAAYQKVYRAIKEHDEVITSGKQAQKVKGIGKSSAQKIDEFLTTGKITALEEIRALANEI